MTKQAPTPLLEPCPELGGAKISVEGNKVTIVEGRNNPFEHLGGSKSGDFNSVMLRQALSTIWVPNNENDETDRRLRAVAAALKAFKPADEIEGMMAAQAVAAHFGAMECLRRAMIPDQPAEIAARMRKDGANLMRVMVDMVDALDRKRGKGPQVVRVERVTIHEGGQAIVGNVALAPKQGG